MVRVAQQRACGSATDHHTIAYDKLTDGGGPHALACGALLPDYVLGVVSVSGVAPFDAEGLDYFAGMADSGAASLRAAARRCIGARGQGALRGHSG